MLSQMFIYFNCFACLTSAVLFSCLRNVSNEWSHVAALVTYIVSGSLPKPKEKTKQLKQ